MIAMMAPRGDDEEEENDQAPPLSSRTIEGLLLSRDNEDDHMSKHATSNKELDDFLAKLNTVDMARNTEFLSTPLCNNAPLATPPSASPSILGPPSLALRRREVLSITSLSSDATERWPSSDEDDLGDDAEEHPRRACATSSSEFDASTDSENDSVLCREGTPPPMAYIDALLSRLSAEEAMLAQVLDSGPRHESNDVPPPRGRVSQITKRVMLWCSITSSAVFALGVFSGYAYYYVHHLPPLTPNT